MNAAVEKMREDVSLEMINASVVDPRSGRAQTATIAFSLSYENPSGALAQKVANELVSLFLNENLRQREVAVKEATGFLREEANRLANQIKDQEAALAQFKQQHGHNLPELLPANRELMARAEEQLRNNALQLRTLDEQQLYLETELDQLDPHLSVATTADARTAVSPEARLQALEAQYAGVTAKYAPTHPDRQLMEREMAALRKEVGRSNGAALRAQRADLAQQLASARERYSSEHPDVQRLQRNLAQVDRELARAGAGKADVAGSQPAENPAYVQLQARLQETKLEREQLRKSRADLESRIKLYEQRLSDAPNVEREYRNLTRGYENTLSKYREVKDKQLEAELAQALETERKAERFLLIEPPLVPDEPVKPNRPKIMMLGMVLSFGAGFGHLALREILDKGLRGVRAVEKITGAPPLAVIPYIPIAADRQRRNRRRVALAGAAALCAVAGVAAVHFFVMPLDLLWFTLLRKFQTYVPMAGVLQLRGALTWNA